MVTHDPTVPRPPVGALRHRRWRLWYEPGVLHNGSCAVETGWYAKGPRADIIEARGYNDILVGIDEIEDALGHDEGDRLPLIDHKPPRAPGPYAFWQPDLRGKQQPNRRNRP